MFTLCHNYSDAACDRRKLLCIGWTCGLARALTIRIMQENPKNFCSGEVREIVFRRCGPGFMHRVPLMGVIWVCRQCRFSQGGQRRRMQLSHELHCSSGFALFPRIQGLSPVKPTGPWWVLCGNETFLRAKKSQQAYRDAGVNLWQIPPRSPDLSPVERFWSWLRRKLRAMDLKDAVAKRPVLGKMAYKSRVRSVCSSQQAQRVAMACARGLKKVCREVIRKKGAATSG